MKRFLYLAMALAIVACGKEPNNGGDDNQPKEVQCNLKGYAQKGQFVKGSQVTAFAVGTDMVATGESFPANISDDLGSFAITGKTEAPYLELCAEGYYFNEVTGSVSSSPMYLEAFVKSNDSAANINLLTTIIRPRVKKLIAGGTSYEKAVEQAQKELLSSKYVTDMGFTGSVSAFDELDITGQSDADGILLALACKILNNRSAAEVTTLVQELASELEDEGEITYIEVVNSGMEVQPFYVMSNMANYYAEKKLNVTTIPPFHKFFGEQYQKPFLIVENGWIDQIFPTIPTPDERIFSYDILATEDFTVESSIADAVIEKTHIIGPAFRVTCKIPANTSSEDRNYTITFKDASGKQLEQRDGIQGGDVQYLVIISGGNTKSIEQNFFEAGCEVSVNGFVYTIESIESLGGRAAVKVPKAEQYSVSYPADKVTRDSHIVRPKVTIEASDGMSPKMIYYGARVPFEYAPISNPDVVIMQACTAALGFRLSDDIKSSWSYIEVTPNAESEYLAGTASYLLKETDSYDFPDIDTSFKMINGIRTKKVIKDGSDDVAYMLTFPQTLSQGFTVNVFSADDNIIKSKSTNSPVTLGIGGVIILSL